MEKNKEFLRKHHDECECAAPSCNRVFFRARQGVTRRRLPVGVRPGQSKTCGRKKCALDLKRITAKKFYRKDGEKNARA